MKLNFLTSLFKENKKTLKTPQSLLIRKLKLLNSLDNLFIFENVNIYHKNESFSLPLLIIDTTKGIYIFEDKEWSYDDLKNASILKSKHEISSEESLAYEKKQELIDSRLSEFIDFKIPIYNFLLMENLNTKEYEYLDVSFQTLLPKHRIIFSDTPHNKILEKLNCSTSLNTTLADIIKNLLVQYSISDNNNSYLATQEQIDFITQDLQSNIILNGEPASGKTNSILLKTLLEIIKNKNIKIIIIQATTIACDKLKYKFSQIIKEKQLSIDLKYVEIITPLELINKHLRKLKKTQLEIFPHIDKKLLKDNFNSADLIICDDSHLLSFEFISYLQHIQKNHFLILVQNYESEIDNEITYHLSKNFREKNRSIIFKKTNPHAKTLQIIAKLLKKNSANDIIIVSDNLRRKKLYEDLEYFIKDEAILLDSSQNLLFKKLDGIILASYKQTNSMESKFVILLDTCISPPNEVDYAINLSTDSSFIIYEDESSDIEQLRIKYAK